MLLTKNLTLLILIILIYSSSFSCTNEKEQDQSLNQTYETAYGTVTYLNDYPMYTLNYTKDYHFKDYLETGTFPSLVAYSLVDQKYACTCFSALGSDSRLFGRNFDWNSQASYFVLFTHPPDGYSSVSTVDLGFFDYDSGKPPDHVENQDVIQFMPYFPFDGMNEKGVAIGMNALPYSQSPFDEEKVTIGELQLIRLVLDYAGSTNEAIDLIQQYNIQMEDPPIHYLIADSSGHSAIVELISGEMRIIENSDPWQVTTNFVITDLIDPLTAGCWRYNSACDELDGVSGLLSEGEALDLLQKVSLPHTRWSTVYNLKKGRLQVAMGRDYENINQFFLE